MVFVDPGRDLLDHLSNYSQEFHSFFDPGRDLLDHLSNFRQEFHGVFLSRAGFARPLEQV